MAFQNTARIIDTGYRFVASPQSDQDSIFVSRCHPTRPKGSKCATRPADLTPLPDRRVIFDSPKGQSCSNMTSWISPDSGAIRPNEKTIYPGRAAYSNPVLLPDNQLGLLYEKHRNKTTSTVQLPRQ